MKETIEEFKERINNYNKLRGLENTDPSSEKLQPYEYDIKPANYKDYCNAYIKALFFNNKRWTIYLEKHFIKLVDKTKFNKLVSSKTFKARKEYFEDRTKKLNSFLRHFIDQNSRFETHNELYN